MLDEGIVLGSTALLMLALAAPAESGNRSGVISTAAQSIGDAISWSGDARRGSASFRSPDDRSVLEVRFAETGSESGPDFGHRTEYRLSGAAGEVTFASEEALGDVLWSPDGLHVAVTISEGGLTGVYRLVIAGGGQSANTREESQRFVERVRLPASCNLRDELNVGAIAWSSDRHLIVAVQPIWEERCAQRRNIAFFEYDILSGTILRTLSASEALRYRARLGPVYAG